jgi:hypothetical protein
MSGSGGGVGTGGGGGASGSVGIGGSGGTSGSAGAGGVSTVNLALNKAVTSTTPCNQNETAPRAVNGNITDKWCSTVASSWLLIDLGAIQSVGQIIVRHAGVGGESTAWNTRDFNLQVSTDGTVFSTVASITGNTASVTTSNFATTSARYVRLGIVTPTSNGDAALLESAALPGAAGRWGLAAPPGPAEPPGLVALRLVALRLAVLPVPAVLLAEAGAQAP